MPARAILRVGLTGGIASGKTTVAAMLAEHGAYVLDADRIAHELTTPGTEEYGAIVARFGTGILRADGTIHRAELGRIVFTDPEALGELETIVHPGVVREIERRIANYLVTGHAAAVIVDAALLVETGLHRDLDRLVVVTCRRDTQVRRLMARGLSEDEAEARIAAQASPEARLAAAHYVVDTDVTLRETRAQVDRVWASLGADFRARFGPTEA